MEATEKQVHLIARLVEAPGAVRHLSEDTLMTLEEARDYGVCVACGRTLTNPESIEYGIGPVCRTRYWG